MTEIEFLKSQVAVLEEERDYYKSLCDSFFLGEIPKQGATMQHFILRQYGRLRQENKVKQAALLSAPKP